MTEKQILKWLDQLQGELDALKKKSGGGGGGSFSEIIEIPAGDGTTSRTFTLPQTPKSVFISWDEADTWSRHHSFIWGDRRSYGFAGDTNIALTGQYATVVSINYGEDGKSFTISGGNAGATFNTVSGSGRMLVLY